MERASIDVLHYEEDLLVGLKSLEEFGQTLVVQFLHYFDLSLHTLPPVGFQQLQLIINLHCDLLVEQLVQSHPHHCIGSLAYSLSNDIVVDVFNGAGLSGELVVLAQSIFGIVSLLRILVDSVGQSMSLG